jgi:ABC-type polysaccharide/polyol phosphate export permease
MGDYLRAVWKCRYFWLSLVKMDLRTRYRRSLLGMGWSLLHPIAMTAILCVAFHKIFHVDIHDYAPFLLAGLACWNYIVTVSVQGCDCLFQGEPYIRQHPAPMAIYPLRTALGGAIHFLIALAVVLVLVGLLKGFPNPPALLCLVPTVLLLFVLGWSLAVLAGFANVYFQDTKHIAEVGFQLLFYATPIMYPAQVLGGEGRMATLLRYNPLGALLGLIREPVIYGRVPSAATFAVACGMVLLAGGAATLTLARLQRRLIFHL